MVVYFFPAAFTPGCSIEAHEFADAMPKFESLGASVIGVSTDNIETLSRFSVEACQNRFPVGSDSGQSSRRTTRRSQIRPSYADRISYLVGPDGKVLASYSSLSPDQHVEKMLAALRAWRQAMPAGKCSGSAPGRSGARPPSGLLVGRDGRRRGDRARRGRQLRLPHHDAVEASVCSSQARNASPLMAVCLNAPCAMNAFHSGSARSLPSSAS